MILKIVFFILSMQDQPYGMVDKVIFRCSSHCENVYYITILKNVLSFYIHLSQKNIFYAADKKSPLLYCLRQYI
jgi:hypothetical protein